MSSKPRSSCRQDQGPAATITIEAKVEVQLSPPPTRSRSYCHKGQGPAAACTTEVKVTATVRGKTPAVNTEVKVPAAAVTKVEETKLKEVVATVVAGEGVETTRLVNVHTNPAEGEVPEAVAQRAAEVPPGGSPAHTILLFQPDDRPETRTYGDYESVNECM